jgi:hypothetical protein
MNNVEYQGTPLEIDVFLRLQDKTQVPEQDDEFPVDDFEPLIDESKNLRQEIAKDPEYNPTGGVVSSKESEADEQTTHNETPSVSAEEDTGVVIQ